MRKDARHSFAPLIAVGLGVALCAASARAQNVDFVTGAVSEWFARTLPLPSASAGVSYSFDPATGNFRRDPATFGQIYVERADPLGAGRFNVSLAYQYTELDSVEGMDAEDLRDGVPIPLAPLAALQIDRAAFEASVHSVLLAASYGVADDFDVSIATSLMISDLKTSVAAAGAGIINGGEFGIEEVQLGETRDPVGIGDLLLRGKYRLLELDEIHGAAGLLLRIPTGDVEDLHGTGFVEVAPSLLASSRVFEAAAWARFQGHANFVMGFNAEDVDGSDARWSIGLDWGLTDSVTAAIAFLARHPFSRVGPTDAFLLPRCDSDLASCALDPSVTYFVSPVFNLSGDREDYYTFSIGGRGGLWRDTIFAFINFAIPLNDGFVRTKPIPMIGIEATI